jgi:hypothetical protein
MKGAERANQYLSFYLVPRNTVKWSKKVVLYLLHFAVFNTSFLCTGH